MTQNITDTNRALTRRERIIHQTTSQALATVPR
jgi:hypothetical protein